MVAVKKQLLQCTLGKHTGQCRCPGVRDFVAIQTQCYQVGAFGKHHSKCHRPRVRDFLATQRKTSQECTLREKKNSLSTTNTNTDHHVQQILKDVIYPNQKRETCSKVPLTLIIAWPLKQPMKTYCYLHLARSSPSSVEIKNSKATPTILQPTVKISFELARPPPLAHLVHVVYYVLQCMLLHYIFCYKKNYQPI